MKAAIIGTGAIAPIHLQGILDAGGEIVALCDIERTKAEALKKKFNLQAKIYSDYLEMYASEEIEVVHICTPHHLHAKMTIAALKDNINALVEKPLCLNLEELKDIKETLNYSKAKLGVCFQNRYLPSNIFAHELLGNEEIYEARGKVIWNRDQAYYAQAPWRGKWETSGGGAMINQAIHTLDLMLWFCGMPESLQGKIENHLQDIEVETRAEFKMTGKYQAKFYATNDCVKNYPIELEIESKNYFIKIIGKEIYVNNCLQELPNPGQSRGKEYWGAGHQYLIKDFYDSILLQKDFSIGIEEAEKALKIIWALYKCNGKEIRINKE
ncbi:MAG: Gfo/Idh/MocA family oxidoreductase [Bacilli bacterium]|nr:Gfo/Idh/MocA family oxidoreductase [Bacilli bacterium]